jgi:hypothetical protein
MHLNDCTVVPSLRVVPAACISISASLAPTCASIWDLSRAVNGQQLQTWVRTAGSPGTCQVTTGSDRCPPNKQPTPFVYKFSQGIWPPN